MSLAPRAGRAAALVGRRPHALLPELGHSVSLEPRGVLAAFGEERPAFDRVPFEHAEGFYDVAKDGKRVAVVQFAGGDAAKADTSHVVLAFDWTEDLRKMFEETRR